MKCTNRFTKLIAVLLSGLITVSLTACGKEEIIYPFSDYAKETAFVDGNLFSNAELEGFASDLVAFTEDNIEKYDLTHASSGILIDLNGQKEIFALNPFEKKYPASITKVMTAYVALKNSSLDEVITCTRSVSALGVPDAVALGLVEGDTMTMDQALHLMLVSSYNDVAVAIAEHVSGSIEAFCNLMNEEALALGATGTHFSNPHGLHEDDHYTTAYDLYLIFNEAIKNPDLLEIIQCKQYQTIYHDRSGKEHGVNSVNTNHFFRGTYEMPDTVTIVGGKTGTTDEGGYCLALYVKDKYSNPYIAVILDSDTRDFLYKEMTELLMVITN
ncbi:MAG: serine hydrolase [Lachnospiraceae bacterium]|nr:serine hydrolase [Lachnospiraceae bacterium]